MFYNRQAYLLRVKIPHTFIKYHKLDFWSWSVSGKKSTHCHTICTCRRGRVGGEWGCSKHRPGTLISRFSHRRPLWDTQIQWGSAPAQVSLLPPPLLPPKSGLEVPPKCCESPSGSGLSWCLPSNSCQEIGGLPDWDLHGSYPNFPWASKAKAWSVPWSAPEDPELWQWPPACVGVPAVIVWSPSGLWSDLHSFTETEAFGAGNSLGSHCRTSAGVAHGKISLFIPHLTRERDITPSPQSTVSIGTWCGNFCPALSILH